MSGKSTNPKTYEALYTSYQDPQLLNRIEQYATFTSPSVFARSTGTGEMDTTNNLIEYDSQSVGAYALNKLATKLCRALFPTNISFFSVDLTEKGKAIAKANSIDNIVTIENAACKRLYRNASYAQLLQATRLLIVSGEALLHRHNQRIRVYSLKDYTVKRNNVGEVLDAVICESKYYSELPETATKILEANKGAVNTPKQVKLYTRLERKRNDIGGYFWEMTQQIDGLDMGVLNTYTDKSCPYIFTVWNFVNGDNYARGYVEEYAADFDRMSQLYDALTDYEQEMLRLMHLASPDSPVDIESLTKAPTGQFVEGTPDKIAPYEGGDYQKVSVIQAELAGIEARINSAFMVQSNQRDAERVTAYEIKIAAEEAEQVLGGVYSTLSEYLHVPLAYLLLEEEVPDVMEAFDKEEIELNITTGIQALARTTENQGLVVAATELNTVLPIFQQELAQIYNIPKIVEQVLLANGVDVDAIRYTKEELQARQQEQQKAAAAQQQEQAAMLMGGQGMQQQQLAGQESAVAALNDIRGGM